MIQSIMHDPLFLAQKSAPATPADNTAGGEEDIYKGIHPEVAKEIAELRKFRQDAENRELLTVAKKYELLGKKPEELKLISCHLGNGSSVTAVDGGKSVETSMGFTPLAGLPMGTRAGDIDAGILEYLMNKYGYSIGEMLNILNKKSGMEGISGVSSDFRDLEEGAEKGNERCALAREKFAYEVKKLIGAYAAVMGGVDAIIFTAGVGENDALERMQIASGLEYMGVKMDEDANNVRGEERVISATDSKVKVLLIPTNEELMIAMDTASLVG